MPTGVYERGPEYRKKMLKCLQIGREAKARAKAKASIQKIAKDPEWRKRVSEGTIRAHQRPDVRANQRAAQQRNYQIYGTHFKGGNGQEPTEAVKRMEEKLTPLGFIREYIIMTMGHGTIQRPPGAYKADFANPKTKTVIELDGVCHKNRRQKQRDIKKTEVFEALGWDVIRIVHK